MTAKPPAHAAYGQQRLAYGDHAQGHILAYTLLVLAAVLFSFLVLWVSVTAAKTTLAQDKARAHAISFEIAALDQRLGDIVDRFAEATGRLHDVNAKILENKRLLSMAELQMALAEKVLSDRAVAMYKQGDANFVDVLVDSASFGDLLNQIEFLKKLNKYDQHIIGTMRQTRSVVLHRRRTLIQDRVAVQRLVQQRRVEKQNIESALGERKATLQRLHGEIKRLEAELRKPVVKPQPAVVPPQDEPEDEDRPGSGWWPLIEEAAVAHGISADGLYRLMMIESGGNASIVGGAGGRFCGLFQYWPGTWKGSWNPWRNESIFNGAAQIKATALAIEMGKGPYWWNPSYQWAFGTH